MSIPQAEPDRGVSGRADDERTDIESLAKGPYAYRTISEVADELHVPQHVLRFWETRFPEVKPLKRGGGRRYYSPEDLDILRRVTDLLYVQGYTIKGVQRVLRDDAPGTTVLAQPQCITDSDPVIKKDDIQPASSFEIPEPPVSVVTPDTLPETVPDRVYEADPTPVQDEEEIGAVVIEDVTDPTDLPEEQADDVLVQDRREEREEQVALLIEEIEALRAERETLRRDRLGLRLALEDILGELDNLRLLLPES